MNREKLDELYTYLKHDRTPNAKKANSICEFFAEYAALEATQHKINSAVERLRTMTTSALEDDEGDIDIKDLIEKVSNEKAIRNARGDM